MAIVALALLQCLLHRLFSSSVAPNVALTLALTRSLAHSLWLSLLLLLCHSASGAPYRSGKAGRYNPQGGAHGCATFL
ncbi:hypothetical protein EIQ25_05405 [Xanthomonas campestris pv. campestris]